MKNSKYLIATAFFSFLFLLFSSSFILAATYDNTAYVINYTNATKTSTVNANFVVQVLKYDPFPVNSGEGFNLWVKVQNTGEQDANHAVFTLVADYPFSSNDSLVRTYGLIYGRANAYKVDQTYDSSQVILKYRVNTATDAPSGASKLQLKMSADSMSSVVFDLPIEIYSVNTPEPAPQVPITDQSSTTKWVYAAIGALCGMFFIIFIVLIRNKIKSNKHISN